MVQSASILFYSLILPVTIFQLQVELQVEFVSNNVSVHRYASEVHTYNTRYALKSNFYKPRSRTNIGKQTTAAMATELWQQLPTHIKDLSTYNFPKTLKEYLLAEQLTY